MGAKIAIALAVALTLAVALIVEEANATDNAHEYNTNTAKVKDINEVVSNRKQNAKITLKQIDYKNESTKADRNNNIITGIPNAPTGEPDAPAENNDAPAGETNAPTENNDAPEENTPAPAESNDEGNGDGNNSEGNTPIGDSSLDAQNDGQDEQALTDETDSNNTEGNTPIGDSSSDPQNDGQDEQNDEAQKAPVTPDEAQIGAEQAPEETLTPDNAQAEPAIGAQGIGTQDVTPAIEEITYNVNVNTHNVKVTSNRATSSDQDRYIYTSVVSGSDFAFHVDTVDSVQNQRGRLLVTVNNQQTTLIPDQNDSITISNITEYTGVYVGYNVTSFVTVAQGAGSQNIKFAKIDDSTLDTEGKQGLYAEETYNGSDDYARFKAIVETKPGYVLRVNSTQGDEYSTVITNTNGSVVGDIGDSTQFIVSFRPNQHTTLNVSYEAEKQYTLGLTPGSGVSKFTSDQQGNNEITSPINVDETNNDIYIYAVVNNYTQGNVIKATFTNSDDGQFYSGSRIGETNVYSVNVRVDKNTAVTVSYGEGQSRTVSLTGSTGVSKLTSDPDGNTTISSITAYEADDYHTAYFYATVSEPILPGYAIKVALNGSGWFSANRVGETNVYEISLYVYDETTTANVTYEAAVNQYQLTLQAAAGSNITFLNAPYDRQPISSPITLYDQRGDGYVNFEFWVPVENIPEGHTVKVTFSDENGEFNRTYYYDYYQLISVTVQVKGNTTATVSTEITRQYTLTLNEESEYITKLAKTQDGEPTETIDVYEVDKDRGTTFYATVDQVRTGYVFNVTFDNDSATYNGSYSRVENTNVFAVSVYVRGETTATVTYEVGNAYKLNFTTATDVTVVDEEGDNVTSPVNVFQTNTYVTLYAKVNELKTGHTIKVTFNNNQARLSGTPYYDANKQLFRIDMYVNGNTLADLSYEITRQFTLTLNKGDSITKISKTRDGTEIYSLPAYEVDRNNYDTIYAEVKKFQQGYEISVDFTNTDSARFYRSWRIGETDVYAIRLQVRGEVTATVKYLEQEHFTLKLEKADNSSITRFTDQQGNTIDSVKVYNLYGTSVNLYAEVNDVLDNSSVKVDFDNANGRLNYVWISDYEAKRYEVEVYVTGNTTATVSYGGQIAKINAGDNIKVTDTTQAQKIVTEVPTSENRFQFKAKVKTVKGNVLKLTNAQISGEPVETEDSTTYLITGSAYYSDVTVTLIYEKPFVRVNTSEYCLDDYYDCYYINVKQADGNELDNDPTYEYYKGLYADENGDAKFKAIAKIVTGYTLNYVVYDNGYYSYYTIANGDTVGTLKDSIAYNVNVQTNGKDIQVNLYYAQTKTLAINTSGNITKVTADPYGTGENISTLAVDENDRDVYFYVTVEDVWERYEFNVTLDDENNGYAYGDRVGETNVFSVHVYGSYTLPATVNVNYTEDEHYNIGVSKGTGVNKITSEPDGNEIDSRKIYGQRGSGWQYVTLYAHVDTIRNDYELKVTPANTDSVEYRWYGQENDTVFYVNLYVRGETNVDVSYEERQHYTVKLSKDDNITRFVDEQGETIDSVKVYYYEAGGEYYTSFYAELTTTLSSHRLTGTFDNDNGTYFYANSPSYDETSGKYRSQITVGTRGNTTVNVTYDLGQAYPVTLNKSTGIARFTDADGNIINSIDAYDQGYGYGYAYFYAEVDNVLQGYDVKVAFASSNGSYSYVYSPSEGPNGKYRYQIYVEVIGATTVNATYTPQLTANVTARNNSVTIPNGTTYPVANGRLELDVYVASGLITEGTVSVKQGNNDTELVNRPTTENNPLYASVSNWGNGRYHVYVYGVNANGYNFNVAYTALPAVRVYPQDSRITVETGKNYAAANPDGTYYFNVTLNDELAKTPNGYFYVELYNSGKGYYYDGYNITGDGNTFNFTITGIEVETRVYLSYWQQSISGWQAEAATNVESKILFKNVGGNSFNSTTSGGGTNTSFRFITKLDDELSTGGTFTYAFYSTEDGTNRKIADANVSRKKSDNAADNKIDTVIVTLPTGNKPVTGNLHVVVGYTNKNVNVIPPTTEPEFQLPNIPLDPETAKEGEIISTEDKPNVIGNTDYRFQDKGSIVPGGKINTEAVIDNEDAVNAITSGETVTLRLTFQGPLANIIPYLEVGNVHISSSVINVVYIFDSSNKSIFGVRSLLKYGNTSYLEFDLNTLYVHLVDIDVEQLGDNENSAQIELLAGGQLIIAGDVNKNITLYEHPVYLVPDNGVPSIGFSGYFTLKGIYPTDGQLVYRLQNDPENVFKSYYPNTGLLNSEIARLANGELLYFSIVGHETEVGGLYIYKPKTYPNIDNGGNNIYQPIARNVTVQAAQGSNLTFSKTTGITVDESFDFIVTPLEPIDNGEIVLHFYKDNIDVINPPVAMVSINEDGVSFDVKLTKIKTSGLVIVVEYRQATNNTSVDDSKAWTNGKTLLVKSTTNGTAKVYNTNGQLVKIVTLEAGIITTAKLQTGNYIVVLTNGISYKVNVR